MTTIAYKDGILAGDTSMSEDSGRVWTNNCEKVFRLQDGSLFGCSGECEPGDRLKRAVEAAAAGGDALACEFPHFGDNDELSAILVKPDGSIWVSEGAIWTRWPDKIAATGSGSDCAMTALRLGHSAWEAVQAGIDGDCFSGGRITSVQLDD